MSLPPASAEQIWFFLDDMKCPNCGNEIPDGSLFCEKCAAEIKIVPEYEARLEEQISSGMESVTRVFQDGGSSRADSIREKKSGDGVRPDSETNLSPAQNSGSEDDQNAQEALLRRQARYEARRRKVTLMLVFLVGAVCAVVILLAVFFGFFRPGERTVSYYVGLAYELSSSGEYAAAADEIDKALALESEDEETSSAALYLLKSEYLQKAGEKDLALGAASMVLDVESSSEEDEIAAYGQMIAIYASYEEYDKIAELLLNCTRSSVVESYPQYTLFDPEFSLEGGEYDDSVTLELTDQGQGSIFYTLDGSTPTTSSLLYREPIELTEGTYEVSAIYVNHFGLQSNVVTQTYVVVGSVPDAPQVSPNSGTYAKQMTITATASGSDQEMDEEDGEVENSSQDEESVSLRRTGTIYYTTDGTDPTTDSYEYTGPITMPQGSSVYRFAVITEDGVSSDVIEREYTYKLTSSISSDDGVNYILIALINRGEIVDTVGTLPGGTAQFNFSYIGLEQIQDAGNFLIYEETLVDNVGNAAKTGRVYAVNATNGTVNLYSDGTLTPIG